MRSAMRNVDAMSWLMTTLVTPVSFEMSRIMSSTFLVATGSRPVVGSSYNRICGSRMSARARPTRLRMPPESSAGNFFSMLRSPSEPSRSTHQLANFGFRFLRMLD